MPATPLLTVLTARSVGPIPNGSSSHGARRRRLPANTDMGTTQIHNSTKTIGFDLFVIHIFLSSPSNSKQALQHSNEGFWYCLEFRIACFGFISPCIPCPPGMQRRRGCRYPACASNQPPAAQHTAPVRMPLVVCAPAASCRQSLPRQQLQRPLPCSHRRSRFLQPRPRPLRPERLHAKLLLVEAL